MELLRQMDASSSSDSEDGVAPEPLGMCCVPVPVVIDGPAQPKVEMRVVLAGCWLCSVQFVSKANVSVCTVDVTFVRDCVCGFVQVMMVAT